jgi:hypothetical protein
VLANTRSWFEYLVWTKTFVFCTPTGHEYDAIDKIASELPNVIDDESRQQVEDYKQACDNGKGPVVACFATGEYLSLFERKHKEAAEQRVWGWPQFLPGAVARWSSPETGTT